MPDLNGFELLAKLKNYPPVIFTTAFDEYALRAFEVNSLDYLLKPVEAEQLENALNKLVKRRSERLSASPINLDKDNPKSGCFARADAHSRMISFAHRRARSVRSRGGNHAFFCAEQTDFCNTAEGKQFPLDFSIAEIEKRVDAKAFIRIHRNALVNTTFIDEVHGWFSGRVVIRLKDKSRSEIVVARGRVRVLKDALDLKRISVNRKIR
jgi:two-component system LytT family response regulator